MKTLAAEHARGKQAEVDQQKFIEKVNTFISRPARAGEK
jgi:chromosome condensin MukBEF MukE localization factor